MKLEIIIFAITAFLIYNTYHGNKYTKLVMSYKKYYQIAIISIVAFSIYMLIKRDPSKSRQMLLYANNMIKYMPLDKSNMSILTPIFDFTNSTNDKGFLHNLNSNINPNYNPTMTPAEYNRAVNNNKKTTKRSVSETKKKYIAYMQDWKCFNCGDKLTHTFEVDHKIRLEYGGGNDVSNLVAMCRECHGQKTAMENM